MRALLSLLVGLAVGVLFGSTLVLLFSPWSGAEARARVRRGYRDTLTAASQASAARRAELEAELRRYQQS